MLNPATDTDTDAPDDSELIAFRKYRDEAWLREQYKRQEKTVREIGELCDCTRNTISRWLDRYDIDIRSTGPQTDPRLNDDDWLREQYQTVGTAKSSTEIASMLDCSQASVLNRLREIGIDTSRGDSRLQDESWLRERYHNDNWTMFDIADKCGVKQPTVSRWFDKHDIESRDCGRIADDRIRDESWLRDKYHDAGLTQEEIAELCDCAAGTISRWMEKHSIARRPAGSRAVRMMDRYRCPECASQDTAPVFTDRRKDNIMEIFACENCETHYENHLELYQQEGG
jgi:transcriptional regulator with XRE-family HTH domain